MIDSVWNGLLAIPLNFIAQYIWPNAANYATPVKLCFLGLILFLVYEVYLRLKLMLRQRRGQAMMDEVIVEKGVVKDQEFAQKLDAVYAPEQTVAALKRQKQWDRAGEIYAS